MRDGALSAEQRDRILAALLEDLATWQVVEVTPEITSTALRLLRTHPLRAGDAIQLASALFVDANLPGPLTELVAFDRRLIDAALREGLTLMEI